MQTNSSQSPGPLARQKRVLFIAEAATLAHVARPAVLAAALDPARFEPFFASDPRFDRLLQVTCPRRAIQSIPSAQFLDSLAKGSPLYDVATLRGYVEEDLAVLDEIQPDVVVGDFRLSLSISARLRKIPYCTISNAYWSPYRRQVYPLPDIPPARLFGVTVGTAVFRAVRPFAFAYHTLSLNRVRRQFGLPSLGYDLRRVYTDADYVLYADFPELTPIENAPDNHVFLGPIVWSPSGALPEWWDQLPDDRPLVYVTLGSSGRSDLLAPTLDALSRLDVTVVAATAARVQLTGIPGRVYLTDFLPGEEACRRATVVVCNGGSPTTHQALVQGKPILGIPSNLDQYLNMSAICQAGVGRQIRSGKANQRNIAEAVAKILGDSHYSDRAKWLGASARRYIVPIRIQSLLDHIVKRLVPPAVAIP